MRFKGLSRQLKTLATAGALVLAMASPLTIAAPAKAAPLTDCNSGIATTGAAYVTVTSTATTCTVKFLQNNTWTVPDGITTISAAVVGGGGGGGYGSLGGGGGGGEVMYNPALAVTGGSANSITIGAGGSQGWTNSSTWVTGGRGSSSQFGSVYAGGGFGGYGNSPFTPSTTPSSIYGGSGGGLNMSGGTAMAAVKQTLSGWTSYGNSGGVGNSTGGGGGGGGGAGGPGSNPVGSTAGAGGSGVTLFGYPLAGGGGGWNGSNPGAGGTGGGGTGSGGNTSVLDAAAYGGANTGGGAGAGGPGGSGTVIIQYAIPNLGVTYFANGGTGTMANSATGAALTANAFTRSGFFFKGWSSSATGQVQYLDGATVSSTIKAINLYAVWAGTSDQTAVFNSTGSSIDYFTNSTAQVIPATGAFTAEAWINPSSFSTTAHILEQSASVSNRFYMKLISPGQIVFYRDGGAGEVTCAPNLPLNQWTHVAVVLDTSTATCFINGQQVNETMGGTTAKSLAFTYSGNSLAAGFAIGQYPTNLVAAGQFNGKIDQVKVWSSALTSAQLNRSINAFADTDGTGQIATTLVDAWGFNEGAGNTQYAANASGTSGVTLTATGSPTFASMVTADTASQAGKTIYKFVRSYLTAVGGWTVPNTASYDYLAIGGGGSGGDRAGGGGGAGGYLTSTDGANSRLSLTANNVMTVTVGAGGTAFTNITHGVNGSDTVISGSGITTQTAKGGGGGGSGQGGCGTPNYAGYAGGSGGGNDADASGTTCGTFAVGAGTTNQGYAGAFGSVNVWSGGGGGGAGHAGYAGSSAGTAGNGGDGKLNSITGSSTCYAAGGGGGIASGYTAGTGGKCGSTVIGGGGSAGDTVVTALAVANTGSGGGGSGFTSNNGTPGSGAAGIVVLRLNTAAPTPTFDQPVITGGGTGFTVNVTNYEAGVTYTPSITTGTVTKTETAGSFTTPGALSLTVTALTAGATYTMTLATSINGLNGSATLSNPGTPAGFTAKSGDGKIVLSFTAPSNGNANAISYQYSTDGTTWTNAPQSSSPITLTVANSAASASYSLRAVGAGYSPATSSVSVIPGLIWDVYGTNYNASTGVWTDSSANGNNVTATGTLPTKTSYPDSVVFNNATVFTHPTTTYNGSTDAGVYTIGAWFKATVAGKVMGFGEANGYDHHMYVGTNGYLYTGLCASSCSTANSNAAVNDGTWRYAVSTFDGTTLKLYINGVLQTSTFTKNGSLVNYTGGWKIGGTTTNSWANSGSGYFTGSLGHAFVYHRALTAAEVSNLYSAEQTPYTPQTITFANGGGIGTQAGSAQLPNNVYVLPAPTITKAGLYFTGWNDGTNTYAAGSNYTMPSSGGVTFTAQWGANNSTLTYNDSIGGTTTSTYSPFGSVTLPSATRTGYVLRGWSTDSAGTNMAGAGGATYFPTQNTNQQVNYNFADSASYIGTGTAVNDVSPNAGGVGATITGASTYTAGSPSYLNIAGGAYLQTGQIYSRVGVGSVSIFAWIYPTADGVVVDELDGGGWHDSQIEIYNGKLAMRMYNGAIITSAASVVNGWHYVGFTFNASTSTLTGYLDGASFATSGSYTRSAPTGNLYYALGLADGTKMYAGGAGTFRLGGFQVWNSGLTSTAVTNNFQAACGSFTISGCVGQTLYAQWLLAASSPTISSQPTALAKTAGQAASFSVTASTADGGALTYQWYKGGVAISGATSATYSISSTATTDAGTYYVVVTNTLNGTTATTQSSSVALTMSGALTLTNPGAQTLTYNTSYTLTLTATGGNGTNTFTQVGTNLPAGLTLSSAGVISGTPTLANTSAVAVTVQVADGNGATTPVTFNVTVNKASQTITFGTVASRTVTSGSFTLAPTTSASGQSVVLTSATTGVCTVSGFTVSLVSPGTCTLNANVAASTNFLAAAQVSQSFTVSAVTVTFNSNYGTPTTATQSITSPNATALTTNPVSRTGYSITNWAISANGTGTTYTNGQSVLFSADTTLYAQWTSNLILDYDATDTNSWTGGSTVTNRNSSYPNFTWTTGSVGGAVTNTNQSMAVAGGGSSTGTYGKLNSSIDTSVFQSGLTLDFVASFGSNADLWERVIDFGHNKGTSADASYNLDVGRYATTNQLFAEVFNQTTGSSSIGLCATSSNVLDGAMHRFTIVLDGSSCRIFVDGVQQTVYNVRTPAVTGSSIPYGLPLATTWDLNYVARSNWSSDASTEGQIRAIRLYNSALTPTNLDLIDGGRLTYKVLTFTSGATASLTTTSLQTNGTLNLPAASTATRSGYTLAGWYTDSALTTLAGAPGASYSPTATATLYAAWTGNTYTVTYNYNSATGGNTTVSSSFTTGGTAITLPTPTRTGYSFGGWFSDSGFTTSIGAAGASYSPTASVTAYAKWTLSAAAPTISSQPTALAKTAGQAASFSVTASTADGGALTYQWYKGGVAISGATSATYSISSTATTDAGTYYVVVTNTLNGTTATTQSSSVALTMSGALTLTNPGAQTLTYNTSYTLTLTASGGNGTNTFTQVGTNLPAGLTLSSAGVISGTPTLANTSAVAVTVQVADGNGATTSVTFNVTVNKASQTITFGTVANRTVTSGSFTLAPTTSASGQSVVLTSATTGVCTVSGFAVSLVSPGTCTLNANVATSTNFLAAAQVSQSFTVGAVTVTFNSNYGTPTTTTQSITAPSGANLAANTFNQAGYAFAGWSTTSGVATVAYSDSASVNFASNTTLYAQWTANTFTVTYNYNSATGGNSSASASFTVGGAAITLPTPTRTGYTFAGWFSDSGFTTSIGAAGASYSPTASVTAYAKWTANSYVVTYDSQLGSTLANGSFTTGGTVTLPSGPTRLGYTFAGWFAAATGGTALTSPYAPGVTSAITLYAQWTVASQAITYNANSGSGTVADTTGNTLASVALATGTGFNRAGYTLDHWNTASDNSGTTYALSASAVTMPAGGLTLYAIWTANTYTVTYDANGGTGTMVHASEPYTSGGIAVSVPGAGTLVKAGYTFGGWSTTAGGSALTGSNATAFTTAADVTLYAVWNAVTYTITYSVNGGTGSAQRSSANVSTDSYTTGATGVALPAVGTLAKTGYTFGGWSTTTTGAALTGSNATAYTTIADVTLYAVWTPVNYSVTYNTNSADSGTAPSDTTNYNIGQNITVRGNTGTLARTGYTFAGWNTAANGTGTTYQSGSQYLVGSANVTLYAKWTANTYTVTYNVNGGSGSAQHSGANVSTDSYTTAGTAVTLPDVGTLAKTGYNFGGWATTASGTALTGTYTTTANITLYAVWNIKSVAITYLKGDASTATFLGFPVNTSGTYGSTLSVGSGVDSRVTVSGTTYDFLGWSDSNSIYRAGSSYQVGDTALTFTALWVPVFAVRYVANGGTFAGSDSAIDTECVGTSSTCTDQQVITSNAAPTRAGYTFAGWVDQSGNSVPTAGTFTVSATRYLIYATWTPIDYSVGYNADGGSSTPTQATRQMGQTFTLANPITKTGYGFAGWSDGAQTYGAGATYSVGTSNVSLSAIWTPNVYNVTYDWNGGRGTAVADDAYTVGTTALTLPTVGDHVKDGYTFNGWSTTPTGNLISNTYTPTAAVTLYAIWGAGSYTLNLDANHGSVTTGSYQVANGSAQALPTPSRTHFHFDGWYDTVSGGSRLGGGGDNFTPTASGTIYAHWTQDSLFGIGANTKMNTQTISSGIGTSFTGSNSNNSVTVAYPADALPAGTTLDVYLLADTTRAASILGNSNSYLVSFVVSWLAADGTVPTTATGKPLTVTITNPAIKAGALVYMLIGSTPTLVGTASVDGSIQAAITDDPELVVVNTAPTAPSAPSAVAGNASATVSWAAPSSNGGAAITGYTVTASGTGGQTCTTTALSCVVSGLTNGTAYTFTVVATNSVGDSQASPASSNITPQASQTITFGGISGKTLGQADFTVSATASSALTVTLTSATSSVCTIASGSIHMLTAGTCTINADQAGNAAYLAAPQVQQSFTVAGAFTLATPTTGLTGTYNSSYSLSLSASGGAGSNNFAITSGTLPAGLTLNTATGVISGTPTAAGSAAVTVTVTDANGATAAASFTIAIAKADQASLTLTTTSGTFGTDITLNATGGTVAGALTFTVSDIGSMHCTLTNGVLSASGAGSCAVTATMAGNANYNSVSSSATTVTFAKASQVALAVSPTTGTYGTSLSLGITGGSGTGAVTYAVSAGSVTCTLSGDVTAGFTLTASGAGSCQVTATKATDTDYLVASSAATTVTFAAAGQTAVVVTSTSGTYGTALPLTATGGSGTGALSFSVTDGTNTTCTLSGNSLISSNAGTCIVTATYAADANYNAASSAATTVTFAHAAQAIVFGSLPARTLGTGTATLVASATSNLTVAFTSATTSVCTVSGTTLTLLAAGTCTIDADQSGDNQYAAATQVQQSFVVSPTLVAVTPTSGLSGSYLSLYSLTIGVTGGTGTTTFAVTAGALPTGVTLNSATGVISGTPSAAGTYSVTITATDSNGATDATSSFSIDVAKANQAALVLTSTSGTFGTTLTLTAAGGTTGGAITYAGGSSSSISCTLSGGTLRVSGAGTCVVRATMAGNSNYNTVSSSLTTVTFAKNSQATLTVSSTTGTFGTALTLATSGGSGSGAVTYQVTDGSAVCTLTGGQLSVDRAGWCHVTATKATNNDYLAATSADTTVTFATAGQSAVTVTTTSGTYGTGTTLQATGGSSTGGFTFAATNGSTSCTLIGSVLTATGAGTCYVTATKAADANYNAADSAPTLFTFAYASQTIRFGNLANRTLGTGSFVVSATASSGLTPTFTSATPSVCTVTGNSVSMQAAGVCTIAVDEAGDNRYSAAAQVSQSFSVAAAINLPTPSSGLTGTYGTAYTLTLAATGGAQTISYAVTAGNLPAGLVLDSATGQITGQPTSVGSSTVTITATDANGATTSTSNFSIEIGKANQAALTVTSVTGTAGTPLNLATSGGSGTGSVTYAVTGTGCTIAAGVLSATAAGVCAVVATKATDANYNAVSSTATNVTFAAVPVIVIGGGGSLPPVIVVPPTPVVVVPPQPSTWEVPVPSSQTQGGAASQVVDGIVNLVSTKVTDDKQGLFMLTSDWALTIKVAPIAVDPGQWTGGSITSPAPAVDGTQIVVTTGSYIDVSGNQFQPKTLVKVWLYSTPILLGTVEVNADGSFASSVAIPTGLELGNHTLVLQGLNSQNQVQNAQAPLLLKAAPVSKLPVNFLSKLCFALNSAKVGKVTAADAKVLVKSLASLKQIQIRTVTYYRHASSKPRALQVAKARSNVLFKLLKRAGITAQVTRSVATTRNPSRLVGQLLDLQVAAQR